MHRQRLWGLPADSPADVLRSLAVMQAQELVPAMWSISQRCGDPGLDVLRDLLAEGGVLRMHAIRPTWHFVHRDDIRWVQEATAERVHRLNAGMYRRLELDDSALAASRKVIVDALRGGSHLTRKQLGEVLAEAGIDADGPRLAYIVMHAELDAVICSGAPRGRQQTYALVDERAPSAIRLSADDALAQLTRRYFTSRGPATAKDMAGWASLTVGRVREGIEMVSDELERVEGEGYTLWMAPGAVGAPPPKPRVDLVQGYDECIMGYFESRAILFSGMTDPPEVPSRPPMLHAILLNGRLAGQWRGRLAGGRLEVDTAFHGTLESSEESALDAAVERLGAFYGVDASRS
jgi:DNA glycosylase AlkZ-like